MELISVWAGKRAIRRVKSIIFCIACRVSSIIVCALGWITNKKLCTVRLNSKSHLLKNYLYLKK